MTSWLRAVIQWLARWLLHYTTWTPEQTLEQAGVDPTSWAIQHIAQDRALVNRTVEATGHTPETLWPEALDPIEKCVRLDDDPRAVYVWILGDDATDGDLEDWSGEIQSAYVQRFGHVPRAVHLTVHDVEDVRSLTTREQEQLLKPWVHDPETVAETRGG